MLRFEKKYLDTSYRAVYNIRGFNTTCHEIRMLEGVPGSGKTQYILNEAKKILNEDSSNKIIVISFPNVDFVRRAKKELIEDIPDNSLIMEYISGKVKNPLAIQFAEDTNRKIPKVILTTHAYLTTRGCSFLLYQFQVDLLWLQNKNNYNVEIFIDESHLFLNSLSWSFKIYGRYEKKLEIGGHVVEPLKNTINAENLPSDRMSNIVWKDTQHSYIMDRSSRNPEITWDRGFFEGQKFYDFPKLAEPTVTINHLFIEYGFIKNLEFNLEKIKKIGYFYVSQIKDSEKIQKILRDLDYDQYIKFLLESSPFYVRTTNDSFLSYDGEPGKQYISGYNYYNLTLLLSMCKNLTFVSATFSKEHNEILKLLDIEIKRDSLEKNLDDVNKDYGCILLYPKKMTPTILQKFVDKLGPILHFSQNKIKEPLFYYRNLL